eukprot:5271750-Amphidinium_carterae.7
MSCSSGFSRGPFSPVHQNVHFRGSRNLQSESDRRGLQHVCGLECNSAWTCKFELVLRVLLSMAASTASIYLEEDAPEKDEAKAAKGMALRCQGCNRTPQDA